MQQIKEKLMRCSATHVGYFGVKDSTSKPATKHMYELKEGEVNPEKKERRRNT